MAKDRLIDAHRRHRVAARRSVDREQPLVAAAFLDRSTLDLAGEVKDQRGCVGRIRVVLLRCVRCGRKASCKKADDRDEGEQELHVARAAYGLPPGGAMEAVASIAARSSPRNFGTTA